MIPDHLIPFILPPLLLFKHSLRWNRVCHLRASGRYGKYIRLTRSGKPVIDQASVRDQERLDGKFVVHSNDDTLNAEDMALGYKHLKTYIHRYFSGSA